MIFYTKHPGGFWYRLKYIKYSNKQVLSVIRKNRHLVENLTYLSLITGKQENHPAYMTVLGGKLVHCVGFLRDRKFMTIWDATINDFRKHGPDNVMEFEITPDLYKIIIKKKDVDSSLL